MEKKVSLELLRFNNQQRRLMENQHSLSTILEEPKSTSTSSNLLSSTKTSVCSREFGKRIKLKCPPPLPEPLPPHVKKHSSVVLRGTATEVLLPHEDVCPRLPSLQEKVCDHIRCQSRPLFETVTPSSIEEPSILVTGFGLRNISSLEEALRVQEEERLRKIYVCDEFESGTEQSLVTDSYVKSDTSETQTQTFYSEDQRLYYLMGLQEGEEAVEYEEEEVKKFELESGEEPTMLSKKMTKAQKYLRVHRIFEFFQFIAAHLLSALPDNPIEFIAGILDKCLIFRSGFSPPPLLYDRRHLECLFYLMDKMRTGLIEIEQYHTGMHTVGLCTYNKNPTMNVDKMVTKDVFIDEAYDCLTALLLDIIKPRWIDGPRPKTPPPPPTPTLSINSKTSINSSILKTSILLR
ncbi:hypothetical protein FQR65_LT10657 [Abscondita terminalis]|nr:hypothetical protein FQR65_LT10657 [Abscondita terminalis]